MFSSPEQRTVVLCLLLAAVTLAVYNPVSRNAFVNFDDDHYIIRNPHVTSGLNLKTVKWAFTNYYEANWHPLTWLSHAADCQWFGMNPAGHHYMNVLLHAVNVILLFLLLQSATGYTWRSLMVAALFALHPVNVESVAWVSERKNVLSMMFFLLTLISYGRYVKRPSPGRYGAVAFLFACGLMAKPQVITLPFVLLLWDYWPLGRFRSEPGAEAAKISKLLLEKVPLFGLSLSSAVVTMQAQRAGGAIHNFAAYSFPVRLQNAIVAYSRYIGKALWPARLSPLYPHPLDLLRFWQVIASALFLLAVTALVIRNRRHGYLFTGWFWFVGTLVPMIGLVQVGEQAMADRYAYLPFIGLFALVCWAVADWAKEKKIPAAWLPGLAIVILASLSVLTYRQIGYWRDSETLWSYALRVTSVPSYKAHFNLAMAYDQQGRYDEAILQLKESIDPRNDDPQIHLGLGIYDQRHGHLQEAAGEYRTAMRLASNPMLKAEALTNLASLERQQKNYAQATSDFAAALELNPQQTTALVGMGLLSQRQGALARAVELYSRAMAVEPTSVGYLLIANAEEQAGHAAAAQAALAQARELTQDIAQAQRSADQLLSF